MSRQAEVRTRPVGHRIQARSTPVSVDAERGRFADAITARIAAAKSRLLAGGLLQPVEWGVTHWRAGHTRATNLHLFDDRGLH